MLKIWFFLMITHLIINRSTPINNDNTLRSHRTLTSNSGDTLNLSINEDQPPNLLIEQSLCDEYKESFGCVEQSNYDNYPSKQSSTDIKEDENFIFHESKYNVKNETLNTG